MIRKVNYWHFDTNFKTCLSAVFSRNFFMPESSFNFSLQLDEVTKDGLNIISYFPELDTKERLELVNKIKDSLLASNMDVFSFSLLPTKKYDLIIQKIDQASFELTVTLNGTSYTFKALYELFIGGDGTKNGLLIKPTSSEVSLHQANITIQF